MLNKIKCNYNLDINPNADASENLKMLQEYVVTDNDNRINFRSNDNSKDKDDVSDSEIKGMHMELILTQCWNI